MTVKRLLKSCGIPLASWPMASSFWDFSDVVETQYGCHIFKLSEKISSTKLEFAKVEPKIKEALTRQEVEKAATAYLEKLRADANITILDPTLAGGTGGTGAPAAK
jgi:peptidyl-prolyl cis-trans isomerase C